MREFQATRVTHEYSQTNDAPPEKVFPLLCPVREEEWVPGWQGRVIYSQSGVAESSCVFATPNEDGWRSRRLFCLSPKAGSGWARKLARTTSVLFIASG